MGHTQVPTRDIGASFLQAFQASRALALQRKALDRQVELDKINLKTNQTNQQLAFLREERAQRNELALAKERATSADYALRDQSMQEQEFNMAVTKHEHFMDKAPLEIKNIKAQMRANDAAGERATAKAQRDQLDWTSAFFTKNKETISKQIAIEEANIERIQKNSTPGTGYNKDEAIDIAESKRLQSTLISKYGEIYAAELQHNNKIMGNKPITQVALQERVSELTAGMYSGTVNKPNLNEETPLSKRYADFAMSQLNDDNKALVLAITRETDPTKQFQLMQGLTNIVTPQAAIAAAQTFKTLADPGSVAKQKKSLLMEGYTKEQADEIIGSQIQAALDVNRKISEGVGIDKSAGQNARGNTDSRYWPKNTQQHIQDITKPSGYGSVVVQQPSVTPEEVDEFMSLIISANEADANQPVISRDEAAQFIVDERRRNMVTGALK